jgi:hypothetical protein
VGIDISTATMASRQMEHDIAALDHTIGERPVLQIAFRKLNVALHV